MFINVIRKISELNEDLFWENSKNFVVFVGTRSNKGDNPCYYKMLNNLLDKISFSLGRGGFQNLLKRSYHNSDKSN